MRKELENMIRKIALEELKNLHDYARLDITNEKGIMFFVEDWDEDVGLEYFIELNDIDKDCYEPCADYNAFSEFGDIEKLIIAVEDYLTDNNINVNSETWNVWWNK